MTTVRQRLVVFLLIGLLGVAVAACGTLEVRVERTPTPDRAAISTLVHLYLVGTQNAAIATQRQLSPTSFPSAGTVSGRICYPGGRSPALILYFRNVQSDELIEYELPALQSEYRMSLPDGDYYAYAWSVDYQIAGLYSRAVPCGLGELCTDHRPAPFEIVSGAGLEGIDICDWPAPVDLLPLPPEEILP